MKNVALYSENQMEPLKELCGQDNESLDIKVTYTYRQHALSYR
jgi:hypothetical protein